MEERSIEWLLSEREAAKETETYIKNQIEALDEEIKAHLTINSKAEYGDFIVSYVGAVRTGIDIAKLKKEKPDVYDLYQKSMHYSMLKVSRKRY